MRLIDADELLLRFIPRGGDNNFTRFVRETVRLRLAEMPTIEAEPIKHGRWKHHQYGNTAGYYECDNCGKINSYKSNYCPKCGADMRGGENETDIR